VFASQYSDSVVRRTVILAGAILSFGAGGVALAAVQTGNPNLVRDTVYDGVYGDSQNAWTAVPIQFAVTAAGRANNFAPAEAFCAPSQGLPLSGANVHGDKFTSLTIPDSVIPIRLTVTGVFLAHDKAEGTGLLKTETIEGQPCVEKGHWTGIALPKGSHMCFSVDSGQVTHTTVTGMTCGEAETAYLAGLQEGGSTFQSPGWDCTSHSDDPIASAVCTQGKMTFRLP
jgi:hypothetical protein